MKCPTWFPFLGWGPMSSDVRVRLGLPASLRWEAFKFDWFKSSITLAYGGKK